MDLLKKYNYGFQRILNELISVRCNKIKQLCEKINFDDLIYHDKGPAASENFNKYGNTFSFLKMIRDATILLKNAKISQHE